MLKLKIIYEDEDIIVIDKPAGLLSIADAHSSHSLYKEVRDYVKRQNPHNKIFIVHRLDKDTSGIILLAKNEKLKHLFQDNWNDLCKAFFIAFTLSFSVSFSWSYLFINIIE